MRPQVGQIINNKYRLVRIIGDGGMGSVYEARHEVLTTTVALKFLHPELSRRSGLVQRFLQEARVSAHIQSPHVVRVTDVDQTANGLAFIVMEYLEGRTLQTLYEDLYKAGQRLSYADALEYAMQMLEGVEAAHRAGIVHRDLKPDNVMITTTSKGAPLIKLLDFGIAKLKVTGELDRGLTRPGVIMGTPEYMAPEQAYSADAVDSRADIFSLGVMIFEMLAGRRPVGGDEATIIASQYLQGNVAKLTDLAPHVPAALAKAVHKAMAPMAKDRFATVAELRTELEPFAEAVRPPAQGRSTPPPPVGIAASPAPEAAPSMAAAGTPPTVGTPHTPATAGTPHTPATNPPAGDGYGPVPKTLPPDDEAPVGASSPSDLGRGGGDSVQVSAQAASMVFSPGAAGPAISPPTPLGGFSRSIPNAGPAGTSPDAPHTSDPHSAMPAAAQSSPPPWQNGAQNGGGVFPATADYGPPPEMLPRPGGTDVGGALPFDGGLPPTADAPPYLGTAPMDPLPGRVSAPARGRKGAGVSLLTILLLAAGVSGAVVGGLFLAQRYAQHEDSHDDPAVVPPPPPPATVITAAPPPIDPPAPPPPTPPITKPQPQQPQPKPSGKPSPTGSPTSTPTSTPSSGPTQIPPPILPGPITLPSGIQFPFPIPGQPAPTSSPGPGPGPTTNPGPGPGPAPSGTGRPHIVIKVPKPGSSVRIGAHRLR